ncbi:MAG: putative sulfoacetate transporter SauU [Verrucomicrobiota bacterium]|jgi:ACS family glucarate transporter-like MFS transporter
MIATNRPTNVRHRIIAVSMLMAFILYLDRICMGEIVKSASFNHDLNLSKEQIGQILGSFFFAYALFQVPAGWASDRFGARAMLTIYITLWSIFTMLTGFMNGFLGLLIARLLCGISEAGAYPTSAAVIRKWAPVDGRARASGMVALGGRIGGTLAPFLTIWMILKLGSWRTSLWVDGVAGLVIALIYWKFVRSSPEEHPQVNAAELKLIGSPGPEKKLSGRELKSALWSFTRSGSLWCNAANQMLSNVGWVFLVTWLPTYLVQERGVGEMEGGRMVTYVLAFGMLGQVVGGYYCDWTTRRFGLRWGRVIPMSSSMFLCAAAYLCCPYVSSTWLLIGCCAVVSFGTDMANPATWAFMTDVGGRGTAAAMGWGNMWGNFGASASAMAVPWLLVRGGGDGRTLVFFTLAGAFLLAGLVVLPMNATKKLLPDEPASLPPSPALEGVVR